ncbi:MAG: GNAT family N-acetyltransferase [Myxococcota bacterium]
MNESLRDYIPGQDEAAVAELWSRSFGNTAGGQTLEWMFRSGAAGPCPRSVSEVDGKIVAHAGVTALRFRLGDEEVSGGYSVGAMTDPAYRGKGLYARLGAHLYERLESEGFAFVAGFSNAQSHRLMVGPLGRTPLRPFPWCVRVLRPMGFVKAVLAGKAGAPGPLEVLPERRGSLSVVPCSLDEERVHALWNRVAPTVRVGAVRDLEFNASRFGTRPEAGYRALAVEKGGQFAAWAVHRTISLRRQCATFVVDLQVAPGERESGRVLLEALARTARKHGATLLSALLPGEGEAREALRGSGFWQIPEPLHPQLIRFSVRGLGGHCDSSLLKDWGAWQLSWADTDVV